ncbi:MAG: ATP-binding cassette domain-containing protein, partial [Leifsonia sp.]
MTAVLRAEGLSRLYRTPSGTVRACVDVDLEVRAGELTVIRGASGAGKTTLLNLLGGLDTPTAGRVLVEGTDLGSLDEDARALMRRTVLGYVFQTFGLIPILTAAENVEVPLRLAGVEPSERDRRVAEVLATVGLGDHTAQRPYELSGGQQQRVGIARALVTVP